MKENGICGRKVTDCTEEPVVNELEFLAGVRIWRTLYTELRKLWFYFRSSSRAVELTTDLLPGINWGMWYCSPESQRLCVYSELNMHSLWVFQYNPNSHITHPPFQKAITFKCCGMRLSKCFGVWEPLQEVRSSHGSILGRKSHDLICLFLLPLLVCRYFTIKIEM